MIPAESETKEQKEKPKVNVNAHEFKPNPNAHAFTPVRRDTENKNLLVSFNSTNGATKEDIQAIHLD